MTIYFKNGMTKEVKKQMAEIIRERILAGCNEFQIFSNEKGDLLLIVNLSEIVYID